LIKFSKLQLVIWGLGYLLIGLDKKGRKDWHFCNVSFGRQSCKSAKLVLNFLTVDFYHLDETIVFVKDRK
jgi:hypothetical protein